MALDTKLPLLITAIGADYKALNIAKGDLTALPTAAKNNLVAAITEVYNLLISAGVIDDLAADTVTNKTRSAKKIADDIAAAITALRNELRAGVGGAFDTFAELAAQMAADETVAAALATAVNNRVRFDAAMALNAGEKTQARANIGAADAAALTALTAAVGNTEQDLVALYVAAKA